MKRFAIACTGPRAVSAARIVLLLLCVASLLAASGCSWFRSRSGYEQSAQTRPLEIPPDLDAPATDPAMAIPAVDASAAARAPVSASPSDELRVRDTVPSTWRRLGLALERIEGASIEERAELLSVYTVRYQGESFLLRVQQADGGSRVSAVSADGTPLSGGAAAALLGALRQRLG